MQLEKTVKKEPNSKISINVKVNKSSVNEAREEIVKDFEKNAKIPGFRKGKVPRDIIIKRFAKSIKDQTATTILTNSIRQIIKEDNYHPISNPAVIEMDELILDEDFSFKAEFDIMPEVNLGVYTGITSERYVYKVNDNAVDREIEALRERFATLVSIDERSKVGNYLVIDYEEYTGDGKTRNRKKDQTILLDNEKEQLTKQLIGLSKGEEKDITINQEYKEDGETKTNTVNAHITVKDVKKKELPELNDDFAKDISDVETVEELKKRVREELEKDASHLSEEKTKDELLKKLIDRCEVSLPETLINYEIDRIISNIAFSYRIDLEKLKKDEKQYQEYRKSVRTTAINNNKQDLILDEIALKEKIPVTDEDLDKEIKKLAQSKKKDFQSFKKELIEKGTIENYKYRLKLGKALDLVYKNAKLNKVKRVPYLNNEKKR